MTTAREILTRVWDVLENDIKNYDVDHTENGVVINGTNELEAMQGAERDVIDLFNGLIAL